jgi:hypothetical protein
LDERGLRAAKCSLVRKLQNVIPVQGLEPWYPA